MENILDRWNERLCKAGLSEWKVLYRIDNDKYSKARIRCSFCGAEEDIDINSKIRYRQNCFCQIKLTCIYCGNNFNPNGIQSKNRQACYKCNPFSNLKDYTQRQRELNRDKLKKEGYVKCELCGYDKCWEALDFHHLKEKESGISSIMHHNYEKVLEEVSKCILVCANCHREIHAGYIKL